MKKIRFSRLNFGFILLSLLIVACKPERKNTLPKEKTAVSQLDHAKAFSIENAGGYTIVTVTSAWPGMTKAFTYALVPKDKMTDLNLPNNTYDAIVPIPVQRMAITSTTHIAALEALEELDAVVGFPNTDLISSPVARQAVADGKIKELGSNENINTEVVLALQPDVLVGFGINDTNKAYEVIQAAGIPVVYNGDWTEHTPLGKAEWIKFFAPFFGKEAKADSIFKTIAVAYKDVKKLTDGVTQKPTVITGGLFKDVWHVAGGKSWMAQFIADANAHYLWKDTPDQGGIGLSFEAVLEKGQQADFWLNPSIHSSYTELLAANRHYKEFKAFDTQKIYSNTLKKGETGGFLFFELAPQRPDLVLKDLVHIFHPELLPEHTPHFFAPLRQ